MMMIQALCQPRGRSHSRPHHPGCPPDQQVILRERDLILARRLWEAGEKAAGRDVVGVVGAGHIPVSCHAASLDARCLPSALEDCEGAALWIVSA